MREAGLEPTTFGLKFPTLCLLSYSRKELAVTLRPVMPGCIERHSPSVVFTDPSFACCDSALSNTVDTCSVVRAGMMQSHSACTFSQQPPFLKEKRTTVDALS